MGRPELRNFDVFHDLSRINRKRAEFPGEDLKLKTSDSIRFMQQISKGNVDEDYAEFLKLLYEYDKNSESYTNEHGINVRTNEVEDEDEADPQDKIFDGSTDEVEDEADPLEKMFDGSTYEVEGKDDPDRQYKMLDGSTNEVEAEEEDDADLQYKMFLANAKPDGRSYVVKVDTGDGFPVFIKYEKECGCNYVCESSCRKKQKEIKMQKDSMEEKSLHNISIEDDEAATQRFSRSVPGYDSNRSMGDVDVIFEPFDPVSWRKNGIRSRKRIMRKSGSKRQGNCGTKTKSREEHMIEKGGKPVNFTGKEKASDVDEDYMLFLENLKCKNWGMQASLRNGYSFEYEAAEDDLKILGNNSSKLKCGTKTKSGEEPMIEKGSKPVNFTGKEKSSDADEDYMLLLESLKCKNMIASLRNGHSFEYEAAEDDLEILDNNSGILNNVRSFNLTASSAKYHESISVQSEFRQKVMDLLKEPYNQNECKELWKKVNGRKLMERNIELRNGKVKSYKTQQMGKSYLDHYEDLNKQLKQVDNDSRKKFKILRGFFFWLQNLTQEDSFKPWKDAEFLALVAESS